MEKIEMYKEILAIIGKQSKCVRLKVGALLVKDDRIISTGWNGTPSKLQNCCDFFKDKDSKYIEENHKNFSRTNEIHAEQNCIAYAARNGISTNESILYVSISPCRDCSKLIIAANIKSVYYVTKYDRETDGLTILENAGIIVSQI